MVRTAMGMMVNPASPFYVKPRINRDLFNWSWKFFRSATADHVERSRPDPSRPERRQQDVL